MTRKYILILLAVFGLTASGLYVLANENEESAAPLKEIELRADGVPSGAQFGPTGEGLLRIIDVFKKKHPNVTLLPATGLWIPGRGFDMQPLMQIAGEVSPSVIYVNFRRSDTYIRNKFLYPLDQYVEKTAGIEINAGHNLTADEYYAEISKGEHFDVEIKERMPRVVWDVIRRECPYASECPYLAKWGYEPSAKHSHTWAIPQRQLVMALFYRKDVFAEAGLPDRVPETCEELLEWARIIANPKDNTYGIAIPTDDTGWHTLSFLYSFGAKVVQQDEEGRWKCVFDSPEAVEAYSFVARLWIEPFTNQFGRIVSPVGNQYGKGYGDRNGMWFTYLDQMAFEGIDPNIVGFGPVPKGATGFR